jgi:hypothetical protein
LSAVSRARWRLAIVKSGCEDVFSRQQTVGVAPGLPLVVVVVRPGR